MEESHHRGLNTARAVLQVEWLPAREPEGVRAYLAVPEEGHLRVVVERDVQGMLKLPGLGPEIREEGHAVALGKVVLALAPDQAVERYIQADLRPFTASTITRPDALRAELRRIRRTGVAADCEEFDQDFCCLAAPVLDHRHRFVGAVGIDMTRFQRKHRAVKRRLRERRCRL